MNTTIKRVIIKAIGVNTANRIYVSLMRDPKLVGYAINRLLHRNPKVMWPQSVFKFESTIPLSLEAIEDHLSIHNVCSHAGAHTIYIHRPEDIERLCPGLQARYPKPFGLKIFKSQSLSPDGTVYYTSVKTGTYTTPLAMWTVGSAREKLSVGNLLNLRGVTPKTHDLIWLTHPGSTNRMAAVVEHVGHDTVCGDEGIKFMQRFKRVLQEEHAIAVGKSFDDSRDFLPPTFNGNIVRGTNGSSYIDIQSFAFRNPKSVLNALMEKSSAATQLGSSKPPFRKGPYLCQTFPWIGITGKRDMSLRTTKIESMLRASGCELEGTRVLDVGCNLGLFMAYFLHKGASFCIGMDTPKTVELARKVLYFYGFSRFELIGTDLRNQELPDNDIMGEPINVLLSLTMRKHIGFPAWMKLVNWRFLVYEGAGSETLEQAIAAGTENFPDAKIVAQEVYQEGDSPPRPLILLRR